MRIFMNSSRYWRHESVYFMIFIY